MSAIDDLAAMQSGTPDPIEAAELLAAMLDLPSVGLEIRGARVVGRGSKASADIHLSNGDTITFDSLRDFANPTRLAIEIASTTGATPKLKVAQAIKAVSLLRALADHHETATADDLATEWGIAYLQGATPLDVDMNDQAQRWQAFSHLDTIDHTPQGRTTILVHPNGDRFIRCGWFRESVRLDDPAISPQEIAQRMERIGWTRRGRTGRIKASRPGGHDTLLWTFYLVPATWENDR